MEKKKVQRQVQMMILLSEKPTGITISNLHKTLLRNGFDMDVRTVRRDMDDLVPIFNIQVTGDLREPVYMIAGIHIGNITFRFEDMQAFQLLLELAKPYNHLDIGRRMLLFLEQLKLTMPSIQREWLKVAATIISSNPNDLQEERDVPSYIRKVLEEGISTHVCIHMRYFAFSNNTVSERDVEPLRIEFSEGCYHLWAFCREKLAIRDFRLSRIVDAKITDISYLPQMNLLEIALKNRFSHMSLPDSERVVIRFKGYSARIVQEYNRMKADRITSAQDGSIEYEKNTAITDDFYRWILGFGAEAEVLEPASLRDKIRQEAYLMMMPYMK